MGNVVTEIEQFPNLLTPAEDERLQRSFKKVRSKWDTFEDNAIEAVKNARTNQAKEEIFQFVETSTTFFDKFFVIIDIVFKRVIDLIRDGYKFTYKKSIGCNF
jgi:hypothetical protein